VNRLIVLAVFLLSINAFSSPSGPSFDCSKATTNTEKTICQSPALSQLDLELNQKYIAFLQDLKSEVKANAQKVQLNWLSNRERACTSQPVEFYFEGNIPSDFQYLFFTDTKSCLTGYYQDAIDAFNRGLISTKVWLYNEYSRQNIELPFLNDSFIEFVETKNYNEPGDKIYKGDWIYKTPTSTANLAEVYIWEGGGNGSSHEEPAFLNIYMDRDGFTFSSLLTAALVTGKRADCFYKNSYDLSFISDLQNFSKPVKVEYQTKSYFPDCDSRKKIVSWSFGEDKKIYVSRKVSLLTRYDRRLFTQSRFYKYAVSVIDGDKLVDVEELSAKSTSLVPIKRLVEIKDNLDDEFFAPASNNICDTVEIGVDLAFKVYFNNDIRNASINYWIDEAEDIGSLDDYKNTALYQTALVFKEYLEVINSEEDGWKKLRTATSQYRYRQRYRSYDNDKFTHPFEQVGLPSLYSCPAYREILRYPDKSLDEQIYNFWARRSRDGSRPYFERILGFISK
jgi:uncharacterized protein YecT (DUF1311 family)